MPTHTKDAADQLLERLEAEYAKLSGDERAACACLIDDIAAAYGMLIGARRLTDKDFSDGLYAVFSLAPALREDAAQLQGETYAETLRPVFESCRGADHPIADVLFEARNKIVRILIDMVDPDLPDKGELRDVLNQAMRLLPRPEDFLSPFNRILAAFHVAFEVFHLDFKESRIRLPQHAVSLQALTQSLRVLTPRERAFFAWVHNRSFDILPKDEALLKSKLQASGLNPRFAPVVLEQVRNARDARAVFQKDARKIDALMTQGKFNATLHCSYWKNFGIDQDHPAREAFALLVCALAATFDCTPEKLYGRIAENRPEDAFLKNAVSFAAAMATDHYPSDDAPACAPPCETAPACTDEDIQRLLSSVGDDEDCLRPFGPFSYLFLRVHRGLCQLGGIVAGLDRHRELLKAHTPVFDDVPAFLEHAFEPWAGDEEDGLRPSQFYLTKALTGDLAKALPRFEKDLKRFCAHSQNQLPLVEHAVIVSHMAFEHLSAIGSDDAAKQLLCKFTNKDYTELPDVFLFWISLCKAGFGAYVTEHEDRLTKTFPKLMALHREWLDALHESGASRR